MLRTAWNHSVSSTWTAGVPLEAHTHTALIVESLWRVYSKSGSYCKRPLRARES